MRVNLFSNVLETLQVLSEPFAKTNRLFVGNIEKMIAFQINVLKSYLDIGLNQMRAAAEVTDIKSFHDFCERQSAIAQTMQYKLMREGQAMSGVTRRLKSKMDHLTQDIL